MPWDVSRNAWVTSAAIPSLTHSVGTGDNALVDVGGAFSQATLNNNLRDLSNKINEILVALRDAGVIAS
jgi:hypothetical protein